MKNNKPSIWDIISSLTAIAALVVSIVYGGLSESRARTEDIEISIKSDQLRVYMYDSEYCYQTSFSSMYLTDFLATEFFVMSYIPVTVTIYNNSDKTLTIRNSSFNSYSPSKTVDVSDNFFYGHILEGDKYNFSIPPGEFKELKIEAHLDVREFSEEIGNIVGEELRKYGMGYITEADEYKFEHCVSNWIVDNLFDNAFCEIKKQQDLRWEIKYAIQTARGSNFDAICII